jgi:cytochrome c biogenesis protein CcmG, thiol:disulfide interchange protein DsbE
MTTVEKWAGRVLFAVAGLLLVLSFSGLSGNALKKGTEAPDATLHLLDGRDLTLSSERGRPVALAFWATWCMPCRAELPSLDRLSKKFPNITFVAVNVEDALLKPQVEAFVAATHLTMNVAFDGGEAASKYHASTIPHLVLLDTHGKIARTFTGVQRDETVAAALEKLN